MTKFRKDVIKLLTFMLVIFTAFFAVGLSGYFTKAEQTPEFMLVQGASLRCPEQADVVIGGEEVRYKGLRFTTRVNDAWFEANPSEDYLFGTLVFPKKQGEFNPSLSLEENEELLEAIDFIADVESVRAKGYYTAAIVYDYQTVKDMAISSGLIAEDDDDIDSKVNLLLNRLYSMELTAVSYVKLSDSILYAGSYTTSMTEVAVKLVKDPEWTDKLSEYIHVKPSVENAYVTISTGEIGNFSGKGAVKVYKDGQAVDFDVQDDKIVLSQSFVEDKLGTTELLTVLDVDNNLTDVTVYYADVAISTAEQFYQIFNSGDYSASKTYPVNNSANYVLMNDINLSGYTFHNTANAGDIMMSGTFDGRGYTVSNVTVDMTKSSNKATQGLFGYVSGTIKNVAFINLKGTAPSGVDVGLTAPLAKHLSGTLENVYIDVNSSNYNSRGAIGSYNSTATLNNVVINFARPENFEFDEAMYREVASSTGPYAYGYGSLGYDVGVLKNVKNVYVISPMPVHYACGAGGSDKVDTLSLTSDYFTYGENETDVWFNFTYFKNNGIMSPTVENTKGNKGSSKTVVLNGLRRYDNFTDMVLDTQDKNVEGIQALLDTGLWNLEDGNVKWHNHTVNVTIDDVVDYDADSGEIYTSIFDAKNITRVTVNGEELTVANGGLIESGGVYSIRAKTSATDDEVGVPYMNNYITEDRYFALTVYTTKGTYSFTKVRYNTMIINDANELKMALDMTYTAENTNNYGFYKLGNDIDMRGVSFNYTGASTYLQHALKDAGFAGQFDGAGYSIKNIDKLGRFGLFGALNHGGGVAMTKGKVIVENLAIINYCSPNEATYGTPVLAQFTKTHNYGLGVLLKNIYVQYGEGVIANGLIYEPGVVTMENVLVDASATNQYSLAEHSDGYFVNGDGVIDAWKASSSSDGGSLFTRFRRLSKDVIPSMNNVISVGYNPLALQNYCGIYMWFNKLVKHTADGDGTYTHTVKNTGWGGSPITSEVYVGYAGNRETGDVPIPVALKPNFLTLVDTNDGTKAYPGYACATCGNTFSATEGTCSCGATLTYYSDLWSTPVSYVWEVADISTYVNPENSGPNGVFVFKGSSKYDTPEDMATAYANDNGIYSSFLGENGNGLWKVNASGELVWKNSVTANVVVKANGEKVDGKISISVGENAVIEVYDGDTQVELTSLTASNDNVLIVSDVAFANKFGETVLTIKYTLGGIDVVEEVTLVIDHDYGQLIEGVRSTCTENGTISHYECGCCGLYFDTNFNKVDDITTIASHSYGDWIALGDGTHYKVCAKDNTHVVRENCTGGKATCTEKAICEVCNAPYGEALGHIGGTANCLEPATCERCGEYYGEALGHSFTAKIIEDEYVFIPADCYNSAVYYYGCERCGLKSDITFVHGEPLGHSGGHATCISYAECERCHVLYGDFADCNYVYEYDSTSHWLRCSVCGNSKDYGEHAYGTPVLTKQPTCTEEGILTIACVCGHSYTEFVEKLEHDYGEYVSGVSATCTTTGVKGHYLCNECGKYYDRYGVLIDDLVIPVTHDFRGYNQPIEPTCSESGRIGFYHCEACDKFFDFSGSEIDYSDVYVPATGHLEDPSGRCACGEVYFDVVGLVTVDPYNSYRATSEYFEFIYVGHIYPGQDNHKWAWCLNRFFGEKEGAPVHIRIPTEIYTENKKLGNVISLGAYVFDVTGDPSGYYRTEYDADGNPTHSNTSPVNGNYNNTAISSVIIPEGIEFIYQSAFGSTNIEELVIPNSVLGGYYSKIGNLPTPAGKNYNHLNYEWPISNICSGCDQLKKVTIGSGIDIIGGYSFYGCSQLTEVKFVVKDNGDGTKDGVKIIRTRAFGQNGGFTIDPTQPESATGRIILPETLVSVPESDIFDNNTKKYVRLYKMFSSDPTFFLNITREEYARLQIPALKRSFSDGSVVKDENGKALAEDGSLMPENYRSYGYTPGWNGNGVVYFKGEWYYHEDGYPRAYAEDYVPDVDYDFADTTFKMDNDGTLVGLTDYGKGLTEITVPSSVNGVNVVKIGSNAFKGANGLTSLVLPSTVTTIADYALADLGKLTSVTATSNVKSVGKYVFRNTLNVSTLTIKPLIANVNDIVVSGTDKIGEICNSLGAFTISVSLSGCTVTTEDSVYTLSYDGVITSDDNVLVAYIGTATSVIVKDGIVAIGDGAFKNKNVTSVYIPNSVTKIGANAFSGSAIKTITLPTSLTEIGVGAFARTPLVSVVIPDGVSVIPERAFEGCYRLTAIEFGASVKEIGYGAFMNCSSMRYVDVPSGIEIIGDYAFYGNNAVRTITLPTTVKSIGDYAFANMGSVYKLDYLGTKSEWRDIAKENTWNHSSCEFEIRCLDGLGGFLDVEEFVTISIGENHAIRHYVPNNKYALEWSSSDESVVKVDKNGVITAVDVGSAEITLTSGNSIGICYVTVTYGDYYPNLEFVSAMDDGTVLSVGTAYPLRPYVSYNHAKFYDATFEYIVSDESVVRVNSDGVLVALATGTAQITLKATWRGISADDWFGLEYTFNVISIGSVEFLVNGDLPLYRSVYAPTVFTSGENEFSFTPTVVVDGRSVYTPSVSINYLDGATTEHIRFDSANNKLVGYKLAKAEVILSYTAYGMPFKAKFLFEVLPNEVVLEDEILFSAVDGYLFVDGVQTSLEEYLGGVRINSAYCEGGQLLVDGNGALVGVGYSDLGLRSSKLIVYTDTAVYHLPISVAKWVIDTPEDFIQALDLGSRTSREITIVGYHLLVKNIDLAGYTVYNNSLTQGAVVFNGVFDGNGYAVKNVNIDMWRGSKNADLSQGVFGVIGSDATIKNVAFENLKGTTSKAVSDVGLQAPFARQLSGKLENVYVHISPDNFQNRGPIQYYAQTAVIKNFVIFYEREEGYVFDEDEYHTVATGSTGKHAYGYGSLGGDLGKFTQASIDNIYVISPTPLHLATGGGGSANYDALTTAGGFSYGENETEVWFNFTYWSTLTPPITNPTVQNTLGIKTKVFDNVRRYDTFAEMAEDNSDRNAVKTQALLDSGMWIKNAKGEIVWKSLV